MEIPNHYFAFNQPILCGCNINAQLFTHVIFHIFTNYAICEVSVGYVILFGEFVAHYIVWYTTESIMQYTVTEHNSGTERL